MLLTKYQTYIYFNRSFAGLVSRVPVKLADGRDGLPQDEGKEGDHDQDDGRADLVKPFAPQKVGTLQLVANFGNSVTKASGFVFRSQS